MWEVVRKELKAMLALGVVRRTPIILVPKPDGMVRFCIDFRKVNAISCFNAYPMRRVDELLKWLGSAKFILMLDTGRSLKMLG